MTAVSAQQKDKVLRQRDRFVVFAFAAADVVLEADTDGTITYAAGAARELLECDAGALIGRRFLDCLGEHDRPLIAAILDDLGGGYRCGPVVVQLATSHRGAAVLNACCLPDRPDAVYVTLSARGLPVSGGQSAASDTVLPRRNQFAELATDTLVAAKELGIDLNLTLLELDGIDSFEGSHASDLQQQLAALMRMQSVDGNNAGQIEANRFGLLHDARIDGVQIGRSLERLAASFDPKGPGLQAHPHTVPLSSESLEPEEAARALVYTINSFARSNRDGFTISTLAHGYEALLRETIERIADCRATLDDHRLKVAYQPIVDLKTRKVSYYELLSRVDGVKSTYEFITFAEQTGIIEEVDLAVCRSALEQISAGVLEGHPIAVNLSGRSLQSPVFVDALLALLRGSAAVAKWIMFEVTESAQMDDLDRVDRVIQQIRRSGHRIGLDDFGAGVNGFATLAKLTVDFIKIDGAYVSRALDSQRDRSLVKAVVHLAQNLGITTVAEMVETEEQARKMRELGVDYGQGYLFGRPEARVPQAKTPVDGGPRRIRIRTFKS